MVAGVETDGGVRLKQAAADESAASMPAPADWLNRLAPASLTIRTILINVVGLVILLTGILYFNQSREGLIDVSVRSLMTQARIMAAAVSSSASIDTGEIIIDPERLLERSSDDGPGEFGGFPGFEFLIRPERAGPVLRRLAKSSDVRARIYDREGLMVVDSRYVYGQGDILRMELDPIADVRDSAVSRWWRAFNDWLFSNDYLPEREYGLEDGKEFPEVRAALNGSSVSIVRLNSSKEIIVSVAVPIQRFRAVLGALVLSNRGGEIDEVLRSERRIVMLTFVTAVVVAILLSVLLASHIAGPIQKLAAFAERVRRGVNNRIEIPDFTARRDEVGHLSGALRDMTSALYNRIDAIEAFAADVAHELKNPLTSLRSAVETFQVARRDDQHKLLEIIQDDVGRLDRLITDISDASRLDAELARADAGPVDMAQLLETFVTIANETREDGVPKTVLHKHTPPAGITGKNAFHVLGHDMRLGQVVRNLLNNARSFSPPGSPVDVHLYRLPHHVQFTVEDHGAGLKPETADRIFERFYTDRPEGAFGKNSGLGLSISKQIVDAHRGMIKAENRLGDDGVVLGARFTVRLPVEARTGLAKG